MLDYLDLESMLTEEERLVKETAREFVKTEVQPDIGDYWLDGTFPTEVIPVMGDLGFFAPTIGEYGLPGVSERAYGILMQELEACDSALRSMASVQGALVMFPIHKYGSKSQKDRWLPKLGNGKSIGCFGLTEPDHGSNPSEMKTTAEPDADGYRLNGSKMWITNAPIADIAIIWGRNMAKSDRPVQGFLVETDRDGVSINKLKEKLSLRASISGEINLSNVWIPEENMLPDIAGMKGPLSCLTQARYGIAWGAVGAARDCFKTALEYGLEREQWGGPIAGFQLQQEKLAEMATQITLSQLLVYRLSEMKSAGKLRPQHVSMAKRNNVRMARNQSRIAREILGGNGITADYSPIRHMTNMETVYTYEGTHDIHSLILGEDLTGISAYRQ